MPSILGVKIDNLTINQALEKIESFLTDGEQHYIVTLNPEFLVSAQKDKKFREILEQADLAVADGVGLVLAAWFLGQPLKGRITGVDLMEKICQRAAERGWPVFLFGGREGAAEEAAERLRGKYQGLRTKEINNSQIMNNELGIKNNAILFVALGAPKQEKWIRENLKKMSLVKVAMGCGGAFDFIGGRVRRAPKIIRGVGLEWLWRLILQPWRIGRIYRAIVVFTWLVVREKLWR